jgi:hypothetical protein
VAASARRAIFETHRAFVCSFRGLFACVLSWVEIL